MEQTQNSLRKRVAESVKEILMVHAIDRVEYQPTEDTINVIFDPQIIFEGDEDSIITDIEYHYYELSYVRKYNNVGNGMDCLTFKFI